MAVFERDILLDLERWANDTNRKPLVLRGARQVGKTSIVNTFGKRFDNYLYVNLEDQMTKRFFEESISVSALLDLLFSFLNKPKKDGRTLLFIDEIQNSSRAVSLLRYFYEQLPDIFVIAAGSLLESMIDRHISFPVGRVEYMALHPVSFREFLSAKGDKSIRELIAKSPEQSTMLHPKLISDFGLYSLIGGMPEIVQSYIEYKDIKRLDKIYSTLINGYRDDVEKYSTKPTITNVIRTIIDDGWLMAGQQISFNNFANSNYKSREMSEAFRTLEKTMLLELVYPTTQTQLPLLSNKRRSPKLLWLDCGLVSAVGKIKKSIIEAVDLQDVWKGAYAEQIVGQELLTQTNEVDAKRHFWVRQDTHASAEVDYVYQLDSMLVPIEVKTGNNAHLRSLHRFIEESGQKIAVRVWSQPFSIDDVTTVIGKKHFRLINLPFYLIGDLENILRKYV